MLNPRKLSQVLRDMVRETGEPAIISLETGESLADGDGLFLFPADAAVAVNGGLPGRRDFGSAIHESRNSRHLHRSGIGASVLYALPGKSDDEWVVGVGTVIGKSHLERAPRLRAKVIPLGGE